MNLDPQTLIGDNIRNAAEALTEEFLESVQREGVKVPVIVYPQNGAYVVWDGHRRWQAALRVGLGSIPAVVHDPPADEGERVAFQLLANAHRKDLTFIERGRAFARLKHAGWSQREIATRFQLSDADVSLAIKAARAHPKVQKALNDGLISPSAVEPLLPLAHEEQAELIHPAIQQRTVRKVRALVQAHKLNTQAQASPSLDSGNGNGHHDDINPLELVTLEELNTALSALQRAQDIPLEHPTTRKQGRATLQEIVHIAVQLGELYS